MDKDFFAGKNVLIMGLGRFGGGVDAAKFACNAGSKVRVTDLASAADLRDSLKALQQFENIEFHLGSHDCADFKWADVIIVNPAISLDNEFIEFARHHNKFVTSSVNIFFELCPAQIIGITGANGKSTTVALTAHLLRNQLGKSVVRDTSIENVWLSGNIGNEPLLAVTDQIGADDLVVLELSSFQAEWLARIEKGPAVALLTNLTPNHLDRHGTFAEYCRAKENIFRFQRPNEHWPAVSVFNGEDEVAAEWFDKYKEQKGRICIKFSSDDVAEEIRSRFNLPGRANLSNLAAAVTIARRFGVNDEQIKSCLPEFKPLAHRLEFVAEAGGVRWYNDSIATTPQSTIAALEAFEQPKIIIAGGYDKNLAFNQLGEKIARNAKAAILLGQTSGKIADAISACPANQAKIEMVGSLAEAVESASRLAREGDVVLLSPACASYDMFDNFQHRGQEFARLVRESTSRL